MEYTVYKHTCPNGKIYIGITSMPVEKRWDCGRGYAKNPHFSAAIKKYGWMNITHEILAAGLCKKDACNMEIDLIQQYSATDRRFGYNLESGGFTPTVSDETRSKQSAAKKGCRPWNIGIPCTDETKEKISKALTGRKASPVSAETREKLRKASTGRALSDEARRKISESKKGKKASTETKQKMSEKRKGIEFTDAHRAALRDAALQREEKRRQARCLTIEK